MVEVAGFNQILESMAQADFFTGILPFVLSYVIFFLLLQKLPLLDETDKKKKFSSLISVALSLYVAYFLVTNPAYQAFFAGYFGRIVIGILGLLGFMMLLAFIGFDLESIKSPIFAALVVLIAVSAFSLSGGISAFIPVDVIPDIGLDLGEVGSLLFETGLIWLLLVGGALYWVTKDSSNGKAKEKAKWWGTPFTLHDQLKEEEDL